MKKLTIVILFLFIFGTSNIIIKSKNTKVTYNKNEIISASYVIPKNLKELDENTPIILKGTFTGNRKIDKDINYFRDIMMCMGRVDKDMIINGDRITFIQNMSKRITYSQVSKIIDIIEETKRKMRSNCNFSVSIQVMALNIYEVIK